MLRELAESGRRNGRSTNAEILYRLERSLSPTENPDIVAIKECIRTEVARALEIALKKQ